MKERKGYKPGELVNHVKTKHEYEIIKWYSKGVYLVKGKTGNNFLVRADNFVRYNKYNKVHSNKLLNFGFYFTSLGIPLFMSLYVGLLHYALYY